MAKTNHQLGWRKAQKNPTTNYPKDSHKKFCDRCLAHNGGCPERMKGRSMHDCSL